MGARASVRAFSSERSPVLTPTKGWPFASLSMTGLRWSICVWAEGHFGISSATVATTAVNTRTRRMSPPSLPSFLRWGAANLRHVFLLDPIHVELVRRRDHLVHDLVKVELRRLREPDRIHPGHDKRLQVGTGQSFRLERRHDLVHAVVELEHLRGTPVALFQRLRD